MRTEYHYAIRRTRALSSGTWKWRQGMLGQSHYKARTSVSRPWANHGGGTYLNPLPPAINFQVPPNPIPDEKWYATTRSSFSRISTIVLM